MTLISDRPKTKIEDLAIFGGKPLFTEKQHVGRPNLGDRTQLLNRINDMLDRNWLTNRGPFVKEFEQKIADYLGVKHCVSTCNGTIALELSHQSVRINRRSHYPLLYLYRHCPRLTMAGNNPRIL